MTITRIHISSTVGANRRPHSGDVFFADGSSYGWFTVPSGEILFSTHRKVQSCWQGFTFRSPKRAAALRAKLEG
jgi:hypothetical protein